ncbi:B-cell receptor CD22-like [Sander vitreus]
MTRELGERRENGAEGTEEETQKSGEQAGSGSEELLVNNICAVKGSTVEIHCSYRYPSRINATVERTFWFTKLQDKEPVDLRADSKYSGRVQYRCHEKSCTLTITDLRESDSAEYKFRFITNQDGNYVGSPGVTLSVTALQVEVIRVSQSQTYAELKCHSSCSPAGGLSYVWFKNREHITWMETSTYRTWFNPTDVFSYAPKLPSVSVSPSAEIVEGSSVTLICSSDANPAANYTWYKENGNPDLQPLSEEPHLVFSSIRSSDSGQYYCTAENKLGRRTSNNFSVNVKYGPKLPSVSVSPSAEIVEGSSVTLTCSSDANPAANYTWYKENEDSPKASGQIFTITDIRAEHSGNYYCEAQNRRGRQNSTLHLIVVADKSTITLITNSIRLTPVGVGGLIPLLLFCRWMRKKKALSSTTEPNEPIETVELDSCPEYEGHLRDCSTDRRPRGAGRPGVKSNQRETHMEEKKKKFLTPNVFILSFLEAAGSRRFEKNAALFVP